MRAQEGPREGRGGRSSFWEENFDKAKGRDTERARRIEEKRRLSMKLASWNVNNFSMRAVDVKFFIAHDEQEVLFV